MTPPVLTPRPASGFRRTPWKNGGGITIDIADAYRPGTEPGSWSGMVWRFGRTTITEPAPFSDLSGYDRILTVVCGTGLSLHPQGGGEIDVRAPWRPVRFGGELALVSALDHGPVEVVNLIGDRNAVAIDVQILDQAGSSSLAAGTSVLYAPSGGAEVAIDGRVCPIAAGDAVEIVAAAPASLGLRAGFLMVASITAV